MDSAVTHNVKVAVFCVAEFPEAEAACFAQPGWCWHFLDSCLSSKGQTRMRYGCLFSVLHLWQLLLLAQGQALPQRCSAYSSSFLLPQKREWQFSLEFSQNPFFFFFLEFTTNAHQALKVFSAHSFVERFLVKCIEDSPHACSEHAGSRMAAFCGAFLVLLHSKLLFVLLGQPMVCPPLLTAVEAPKPALRADRTLPPVTASVQQGCPGEAVSL